MHVIRTITVVGTALCVGGSANAQFTYNSPTGSPLPATVSAVGGIVADLIGTNGTRVVAQRAASGLFRGNVGETPFTTIGTQTGFSAGTIAALGGGIAQAAFRLTLSDGDNRAGDFDFNQNFLRVNGQRIQNFSDVQTVRTTGTGALVGTGNQAGGFGDDFLYTGFFFTSNASVLSSIFTQLMGSGSLLYEFEDLTTASDTQFLDFTQGLDASVIDIGLPPVVTPPGTVVPEPSTILLLATGLAAVAAIRRRRAA